MAHTAVPPVFLVTGFLGSGKTLFLQALLAGTIAGTNNAVIVNDFGETVYDDMLLRARATAFLELPGGCLCCSALDDFRQALTAISARTPHRIFVETTGLADAAAVRDDLHFMGFPIDAVFCTVDALHWRRQYDQFPTFAAQVAEADVLLVSKTDLAGTADAPDGLLRSLNSRAPILHMHHGRVDSELLLPLLAPVEHVRPPHDRNQLHLIDQRVTAYRIRLPHTVHRTAVDEALRRLPPSAVRLKGRLRLHDSPEITEFLVNFVHGRWTLTPVPGHSADAHDSTLALIGFDLCTGDVEAAFAAIDGAVVEQAGLYNSLAGHLH